MIGTLVEQFIKLTGIGQFEFVEPAVAFCAGIDQGRVVIELFIDLNHSTRGGRVHVGSGLDRLDHGAGIVRADAIADGTVEPVKAAGIIRHESRRLERLVADPAWSVDDAHANSILIGLANGTFAEGSHPVQWNGQDAAGRDVSSGTYLVQMETEAGVQSSKMMLVR